MKQFNRFPILIGLMILIHSVVQQWAPFGYLGLFDYFWDIHQPIIGLSVFPSGDFISEAVPFWIPRWAEILGAIGLFWIPLRRTAGALLVLSCLYICLFNYPGFGVGEPLFFLIGFAFVLYPGRTADEQDRARALIIGFLTGMYVLSAFEKMNPSFLSGQVLLEEISAIFKPHSLQLLTSAKSYEFFSLAGITIELLAALIFFVRSERLGFLAALVFHCFNAAQINWAFSVEILPAAFPFLFGWREEKSPAYFYVVFASFVLINIVGLGLSQPWAVGLLSPSSYDLLFVLAPFAIALPVLFMNFDQIRNPFRKTTMPIYTGRSFTGYRIVAFAACLILTVACRSLDLPAPLGFTQFSGRTTAHADNYVLGIQTASAEIGTTVFKYFGGRWDIRLIYADAHTALLSFPQSHMRDALQKALCVRSPGLSFIRFEMMGTAAPSPIGAIVQNVSAKAAIAIFEKNKSETATLCQP
jgi:hypothetical protein